MRSSCLKHYKTRTLTNSGKGVFQDVKKGRVSIFDAWQAKVSRFLCKDSWKSVAFSLETPKKYVSHLNVPNLWVPLQGQRPPQIYWDTEEIIQKIICYKCKLLLSSTPRFSAFLKRDSWNSISQNPFSAKRRFSIKLYWLIFPCLSTAVVISHVHQVVHRTLKHIAPGVCRFRNESAKWRSFQTSGRYSRNLDLIHLSKLQWQRIWWQPIKLQDITARSRWRYNWRQWLHVPREGPDRRTHFVWTRLLRWM